MTPIQQDPLLADQCRDRLWYHGFSRTATAAILALADTDALRRWIMGATRKDVDLWLAEQPERNRP